MIELPLEIIQRIITISLPRSNEDYRSRQNSLLPLCTLHSSLRRFVQLLLFGHPVLDDRASAMLFLDTVEGNEPELDFGSCVQSLQMIGPWDEATEDDVDGLLVRIFASCGAIEEISLDSIENVNFARFAKLSSE